MKNKHVYFGFIFISILLLILIIRDLSISKYLHPQKRFRIPISEMFENNKVDFKFSLIGDTGSENLTLQNIINHILKNEKPDFILHLGDLTRYKDKVHLNWLLSEILSKLRNIRFYIVPGNHDANKKFGLEYFESIFGNDYYWFSYGDTIFIGLNTSNREVDDLQLDWLNDTLNLIRPRFKHCVIFTHIPPYPIDENKGHALSEVSSLKLKNVLKDKKIDFIFFGHIHQFKKENFAGIPSYTLPSTGQVPRSKIKKFGYISVSKNKDGFELKNSYLDIKREAENFDIRFVNIFYTDRIIYIIIFLFISTILYFMCIIFYNNFKNKK